MIEYFNDLISNKETFVTTVMVLSMSIGTFFVMRKVAGDMK